MFARSQQLSAPLVLPMLASTLSVGILASIFLLPPPRATLSLPQLLLQGALDLTLAACIHLVTVTASIKFSVSRAVLLRHPATNSLSAPCRK